MTEQSGKWESRPENHVPPSFAGSVTEHATIGASVVIKGEVSGTEPLYIDGRIEGSISFPNHRVTLGRSSHILADIRAHDVVVMGSVEGNICCTDLLDIRAESTIKGHMIAQRIRIDDGASLKGGVEVHSAKRQAEAVAVFSATAALPPKLAEASAAKPAEASAAKPAEESAAAKPVEPSATKSPETPNPEEAFKATLREAAASVSVAGGQPARRVTGSRTLIEPTH